MKFIIISIYFALLSSYESCRYPEFLQSFGENNTMREWHSHITFHGRETLQHYSLATFIRDNTMRVLPYGGQNARNRPKPHKRECFMQVTATRYLARYTVDLSDKENHQFICMEFISRSPYIFQLKQSKLSSIEDPNLCSNMTLDYWMFVNKGDLYHSYMPCPLKGGYTIQMFDKAAKIGVCDGYNGETRLEIGCLPGEGMTFLFRYSTCVPNHLHMHAYQPTYCIASWQQGRNMFTVLRHDKSEHMWCLRYPANHTNAFTAFLFKSLYCDPKELPETEDYIRIDMTRESPRGLNQLCVDDYEACSYWSKPCNIPGDLTQLTCAKKCGICTDSGTHKRPDTCILPQKFRGSWHIKDDHGIYIKEKSVILKQFGELHCIDWENRRHNSGAEYIEQMFVTTFDNGCRPRYYCSQLKKHSHSVLRFKMSQGQLWPFHGTNGITIDCGSFNYKDDHDPYAYNYQSRYFKTLTSTSDTVYVNCQLGHEKRFEVIFQDGTKCKGSLTQDGLSTVTKMKLTLTGKCPGRQTEQEFACLDSTKHMHFSQQLIVTESLDNNALRIKCWVFPTYPEDIFYLLSIEDCHEGAHERVNSQHIKPIATFSIKYALTIKIEKIGKKNHKHTSTPRHENHSPQNIDTRHPTYKNDIVSRDVEDKDSSASTNYVPVIIGRNGSQINSQHVYCFIILIGIMALLV